MKITPEIIEEYKELHLKEFGVLLADDEAEKQARRWLSFFSSIFNSNDYESQKSQTRVA